MLQGTPHVGGIAYVPKFQGLVVATNQSEGKKNAQLAIVSLKSIEEYTLEQPISYQQTLDLKDISYISSVAYYDNTIVIGYFNKDAHT